MADDDYGGGFVAGGGGAAGFSGACLASLPRRACCCIARARICRSRCAWTSAASRARAFARARARAAPPQRAAQSCAHVCAVPSHTSPVHRSSPRRFAEPVARRQGPCARRPPRGRAAQDGAADDDCVRRQLRRTLSPSHLRDRDERPLPTRAPTPAAPALAHSPNLQPADDDEAEPGARRLRAGRPVLRECAV